MATTATEDTTRLIAHYDKLAPRYEKLYEGQSRLSHFYKSRQTRVSELLEGVEGGNLLDVGCGAGLTVDTFLAKGMRYHGIDISPGMIKACKERFRETEKATFSVGDTRSLPFPDREFDVVVCMGVLEYVRDEQRAVGEMARVLKSSGALIISGITKWSPFNVFDRSVKRRIKRWRPVCIIHEFHTEREYRVLLRAARLQVVDVVYFDFSLVLPPVDGFLPAFAASSRTRLEPLGSGRLRRLGNGFLVRARKAAS